MASYLETIPLDILQHIGFLAGSCSALDPPVDMFHLLQTSSTMYHSLNTRAAPHLYSQIFSTKFDMQAAQRRYQERLPDSARCAELLSRSRLLRRSHRVDLSLDGLIQDLWTALWMVMENDGLNFRQLYHANFCHFLLRLAHVVLADTRSDVGTEGADSRTRRNITLWLLCLSLPRRTILNMPKEGREEFYSLIFPYMSQCNKDETFASLSFPVRGHENQGYPVGATIPGPGDGGPKVNTYLHWQNPIVPDPSIAAINLAFVVLEVSRVIRSPPHFPETRAIALATLRSGPTQEDYRAMASYQTALLADLPCSPASPPSSPSPLVPQWSTHSDMIFGDIVRTLSGRRRAGTFQYIPGTLSGLWEGIFKTVESPIRNSTASIPNYQTQTPMISITMMKPIQCHLVEYICVSPDPGLHEENSMDCDLLVSDICSPNQFDFAGTVKHETEIVFKGRKYNRQTTQADTTSKRSPIANAALLDVIVLGEVGTLEDHDEAWGGFRFLGRIRSDGRIYLKREPKYVDTLQPEGSIIFEGQLRFDSLMLGHWRFVGTSNHHHGVFSLGKSRER